MLKNKKKVVLRIFWDEFFSMQKLVEAVVRLLQTNVVTSKLLAFVRLKDVFEFRMFLCVVLKSFEASFNSLLFTVAHLHNNWCTTVEDIVKKLGYYKYDDDISLIPAYAWHSQDFLSLNLLTTSHLRCILTYRMGKITQRYPRSMLLCTLTNSTENLNCEIIYFLELMTSNNAIIKCMWKEEDMLDKFNTIIDDL